MILILVTEQNQETDKTELENKIPNISGLDKKTDYNTKIAELESKIPDISNLATKTHYLQLKINSQYS